MITPKEMEFFDQLCERAKHKQIKDAIEHLMLQIITYTLPIKEQDSENLRKNDGPDPDAIVLRKALKHGDW